jgi:hypothetical protein
VSIWKKQPILRVGVSLICGSYKKKARYQCQYEKNNPSSGLGYLWFVGHTKRRRVISVNMKKTIIFVSLYTTFHNLWSFFLGSLSSPLLQHRFFCVVNTYKEGDAWFSFVLSCVGSTHTSLAKLVQQWMELSWVNCAWTPFKLLTWCQAAPLVKLNLSCCKVCHVLAQERIVFYMQSSLFKQLKKNLHVNFFLEILCFRDLFKNFKSCVCIFRVLNMQLNLSPSNCDLYALSNCIVEQLLRDCKWMSQPKTVYSH